MYPNIEAERVRQRLTRETLAEKLGINRKTLRKWVNYVNIPPKKLSEMVDLFGCFSDYLLATVQITTTT